MTETDERDTEVIVEDVVMERFLERWAKRRRWEQVLKEIRALQKERIELERALRMTSE